MSSWRQVLNIGQIMREAAEKEIMPRFGKIKVEEKNAFGKKETVTQADIGASEFILDRVRKDFPGSYSEEHLSDDRFNYDRLWQFDPLDGTAEFCDGMLDGFAMHGAFLERDSNGLYKARAGIIYLPGAEKLWCADDCGNIHLEEKNKRIKIPEIKRDFLTGWIRKLETTGGTGIFYNNKGRQIDVVSYACEIYKGIAEKLGLESKVVTGGGSGASISDLLEGKTNLVICCWHDSKEWDISMAAPLLEARGGFICDFSGNEYTYNKKDLLNRNGYIASTIFKKEEIIPLLSPNQVLKKH